ncbi:hypothetical protein ACO0LV_17850 [Pseudactinotalea sp. Z1739]
MRRIAPTSLRTTRRSQIAAEAAQHRHDLHRAQASLHARPV